MNGLDLSVREEEPTNDIPGLNADIYFGDPSIPLPNWREVLDEEDDDSDELSPEEKEAVERMIGFSSDDAISMPEVRPSPLNKQGKDLSTAQQPKVDLHGKPCGVGQNQTRDGCIPNEGQSQAQQQPVDNATQAKPGSNYSAQFDPSKVKESDKPSEEEVLGTKEPEDKVAQASKEWKEKGTKSKFFKSWFGDWENDPENASKVVDKETGAPKETGPIRGDDASKVMKDGRPIMVYHGTPSSKFNEFRKDKIHDPEAQLYGPGFYFTEDSVVADSYQLKDREFELTVPLEEAKKIIADKIYHAFAGKMIREDVKFKYVGPILNTFFEDVNPVGQVHSLIIGLNRKFKIDIDVADIMRPTKEGHRFNVYLNIRKPFDANKDSFAFDELPSSMQEALISNVEETHGEEMRKYQKRLRKISAELEKASEADQPKWESKYGKYKRLYADAKSKYDRITGRIKSYPYSYDTLKGYEFSRKEINDMLAQKGYDGITHMGGFAWGKGDRLHRVWIAFESNQIKSSENQGTFDPNENDMNKSLLVPIDKALSWKTAK